MTAQEPLRSFNFSLEIGDLEVGRFIECSGLGAEVEVIAYREGGANMHTRHLPGQTRYSPVTLRYGLTANPALWTWFQESMTGTPTRRNISLIMHSNDGKGEAFRWNLIDAWVSSWKAAQLDASVSDVAVDTLTLVYDRLERD